MYGFVVTHCEGILAATAYLPFPAHLLSALFTGDCAQHYDLL